MIYILLKGSSVKQLERYAHLLDSDNIFASVNNCFYEKIMGKVGHGLDYIHASCDLKKHDAMYIDYLKRHENTTIITSAEEWGKQDLIMWDEMTHRVILSNLSSGNSAFEGWPKYNSVTALLLFFLQKGFRSFAIFGMDGVGAYYDEFDSKLSNDSDLLIDTKTMNERFWQEVDFLKISWGDVSIINVNPDSFVECFPKMSYEDFFTKIKLKGE